MTDIGIYTHESRRHELAITMQSLEALDLHAKYVSLQTTPGSQTNNRLNAFNALKNTFNDRNVLILEDDVIAGFRTREWIEYLNFHSRDVTCMLPMKPEFYSEPTEIALRNQRKRERLQSALEVNPRVHHWWGSQAVWIPARIAELILNDERFTDENDKWLGPWDHAIRKILLENNERMLVTLPAVFQHQSPPSVRERRNRRIRQAAIFNAHAGPPKP